MSEGIQQRFSRVAEDYSGITPIQKQVGQSLADILKTLALADPTVLELGCGTGFLTTELSRLYKQKNIVAIDISGRMLEVAKAQLADVTFVRGNFEFLQALELPVAMQRYDLIVSSSALQWAVDLDRTLEGISSALAPNGYVAFAIMIRGTLAPLQELRRELFPDNPPRRSLYSAKELELCFGANNIDILSHAVISFEERHASGWGLLKSLHRQGVTGGALSQGKRPLTRGELSLLAESMDEQVKTENSSGGMKPLQVPYVVSFLVGKKRDERV